MSYTRLIDLLPWQLKNHPLDDCISIKINGEWKKYSTQEVIDRADQVSRALLKFGLKPGDKVALIANNRPEWNFVDQGVLGMGCVLVPIYPTISEGEYKFIFNDAEIKVAFISDHGLFKKVDAIKGEVPSLQAIFSFDEVPGAKHFNDFLALDNDKNMTEVNEIRRNVHESELATIIYTSGTTGTPKGVMLSHHNIVSNLRSVSGILPIECGQRALSFLPLCHIFERVVVYTYFSKSVSIYYAESMETIAANLKEVKPHFFSTVPRLLEKVYNTIVNKGLELTGIKKALFFWALNLGLKFDDHGNNGAFYNLQLGIARKLIFSKWQEALGGNVVGIVTGAAALQNRLAKVFNAAGIIVRQGYGQTETSPVVTVDRFEQGEYMLGSVGQVIPGVQIKFAEGNNEILVKGPNLMMGYYKRQDLTAQTIDADGWLHTGDVGELIEGKYLHITDRVKELFKTSGGKYVAPQVIENKMKESPFIEQMMVIGENEKFVSALIVPNFQNLADWAKRHNVAEGSNADMLKNADVQALFKTEVDKYNKEFGHVEQVKRFKLLADEWSTDGGELTPTLKLKRKPIMEKYKNLIAEIYNVE